MIVLNGMARLIPKAGFIYNTTNASGCDSTATLNLTINNSSSSSVSEVACDSYFWNDEIYIESGVYTYNTTNASGCDSTATLNLTINNSSSSSVTEVACDSFEWNGETYTESGVYTYILLMHLVAIPRLP